MEVLVTGGAGYIGSHTCLELLNAGYNVIVADNLCNSSYESLKRVQAITGKTLKFYQADINDEAGMNQIFSENKVDAVVHFAGLKAVGESVQKPLEYYRNNISGTLVLLDCMRKHGVKNMVFSSSATVYGLPRTVPIKEDFPLSTTNPYGSTKLMIENILTDIYRSDEKWNIILLRYFNPIGAHESGMIGEDPDGIPNNLVPYIAKVAVGRLPYVNVFGNDYKTKDGTGVRDYIHVVDLAEGHLKALEKINGNPGLAVYNLGTGVGYSVLEIIDNFGKACGKEIPYRITDRRPGDIDICYADATKAKKELGWQARYGIDKMCKDTWNWQNKNPEGYR
jgi:UDP-glucose 4-epimerase